MAKQVYEARLFMHQQLSVSNIKFQICLLKDVYKATSL
jgi:hypothetical protein